MKIYRCGWCGYPVDQNGDELHGVHDTASADEYLEAHHGAEEVLVDGVCCPGGPEQVRDRIQVTREMAIDAGDPTLEGTWIIW